MFVNWCRADIDIPDPDEDVDEEAIIEQRRLARKEFEQVLLVFLFVILS